MECLKNTEMGLKVGDILTGSTHMYCTRPYFYKVTGFAGKTQIKLQRMHVVYHSEYGPNHPCYSCIPAECMDEVGGTWYDVTRDFEPSETPRAVIKEFKKYAWDDPNTPPEKYVKILGDKYGPILRLWDRKPEYGNCD